MVAVQHQSRDHCYCYITPIIKLVRSEQCAILGQKFSVFISNSTIHKQCKMESKHRTACYIGDVSQSCTFSCSFHNVHYTCSVKCEMNTKMHAIFKGLQWDLCISHILQYMSNRSYHTEHQKCSAKWEMNTKMYAGLERQVSSLTRMSLLA